MSGSVRRLRVGPVLELVLDRPERRNALSQEIVIGLTAAFEAAAADPEIRVITLTGAGDDFCSGADLKEMVDGSGAPVTEQLEDADRLARLFLTMRAVPQPIVALVRGRALAGGCGLATACDLVLAAENARFGYPEIRIGFVPAMVIAFLHRQVPEKRAFELIALGDSISAAEAERIGLVNRVLPDEGFDVAAREYTANLVGRSASALALGKRLLHRQDGMTLETALRTGAEMNVLARQTPDAREGASRFLGRSDSA